jgi:putative (di)nucleoside polyphosphate hydrolase
MRFLGEDRDIDLEAHKPPEFDAFQWVEIDEVPRLIVPFKRDVYEKVVQTFRHLIR